MISALISNGGEIAIRTFLKFWNSYERNLNDIRAIQISVANIDSYPYRYTKSVGLEPIPEKIYKDLMRSGDSLDVDIFYKIWHKYNYLLTEEEKDNVWRSFSEGFFYALVIEDENLGEEMIKLLELIRSQDIEMLAGK